MLDCRARIPAERPRRKEVREWRDVRTCFYFIISWLVMLFLVLVVGEGEVR